MDKAAALNSAQAYAREVCKHLSPTAIYLFGSYVNGTPNEDSDIDIAVIMNHFQGDFLSTSAELWNLTWDIDNRIEPILLDEADDKLGFVKTVINSGQLLYRA